MRYPAQAISGRAGCDHSILFRLAMFSRTEPILLERVETANGASRRNVFSSEQSLFDIAGRLPRDTLKILGGDASDANASNGQSSFQTDVAPASQVASGAIAHHAGKFPTPGHYMSGAVSGENAALNISDLGRHHAARMLAARPFGYEGDRLGTAVSRLVPAR